MEGNVREPVTATPSLERRVADLEAWRRVAEPLLTDLIRQQEKDRALTVESLARIEARVEARIVEGVDAMNVVGLNVQRQVSELKDGLENGVRAVEEHSQAIKAECHRTNEMVAQLLAKGGA